jgi:phage/plasmid-associated DNA primase
MIDILDVFRTVASQHRAVDTAESDFKKMIFEDLELHKAYRNWCEENGYSEKLGFIEYCNELLDEEQSKWDVLSNEYE